VSIETIPGDVQFAAEKPFRPLDPSRSIEHLIEVVEPLDSHLAHHAIPELLRIFAGIAKERLAVREA